MTQSVTFPVVIKKSFNEDFSFFILKDEDSKYRTHITIENTCNALLEAGIIDDYDESEGIVIIDTYVSDEETIGERCEVKYFDILDFISELSLEECGRVLKYFHDNNAYLSK